MIIHSLKNIPPSYAHLSVLGAVGNLPLKDEEGYEAERGVSFTLTVSVDLPLSRGDVNELLGTGSSSCHVFKYDSRMIRQASWCHCIDALFCWWPMLG